MRFCISRLFHFKSSDSCLVCFLCLLRVFAGEFPAKPQRPRRKPKSVSIVDQNNPKRSHPFNFGQKMRRFPLMKSAGICGFFVLLVAVAVSGQNRKVPTFSQYPAKVEKAQVKAIDFRHSRGAETFRTRLTDGLRRGINFAGHYIVVGWGCGTGCISGGIIDARNGRVYFPNAFHDVGVWYDNNEYTPEPVKFKKNSRLFVISGISGDQEERSDDNKIWGDYYYQWKGDGLRLIKFVPRKRTNEQ